MPRGAPNTAEQVAAVKQELLTGATYRVVSERTGVPFGTVGAIGNRMTRSGEMPARGKLAGLLPTDQRSWT